MIWIILICIMVILLADHRMTRDSKGAITRRRTLTDLSTELDCSATFDPRTREVTFEASWTRTVVTIPYGEIERDPAHALEQLRWRFGEPHDRVLCGRSSLH